MGATSLEEKSVYLRNIIRLNDTETAPCPVKGVGMYKKGGHLSFTDGCPHECFFVSNLIMGKEERGLPSDPYTNIRFFNVTAKQSAIYLRVKGGKNGDSTPDFFPEGAGCLQPAAAPATGGGNLFGRPPFWG